MSFNITFATDGDAQRLFEMILNKNVDAARTLLEFNQSLIEARNHEYYTPLMYACIIDYWNMIDMLLNKGANINAFDIWGKTVLMYSCHLVEHHDNLDNVKKLIERGANYETRDKIKQTFIDFLPLRKKREIKYFIRDLSNGVNIKPCKR